MSVTKTARTGTAPAADLRAKFRDARAALAAALIERDDEVDLCLTALLAGEHVLLVGAPGAAKSLLLDSLMGWVRGERFSILLTKFTTPEEVVGPVSLAALKEDRYARVTRNRLPEADVAFIDEIWKASSAILNTLLRLLNEGVFENDGRWVQAPLRLCVAASNEWPGTENGKELSALLDRFLFRKTVRYVQRADSLERLLFGQVQAPAFATQITPEEIDRARAEAKAVPWSQAGKDALLAILKELAKEGIVPSDRRKRKAVGAAQAAAYLAGDDEVQPEHLECLQYVLWDDPAEHPVQAARVVCRIANPTSALVAQHLLEADQIAAACNPRDLADAATATAKLSEIAQRLRTVKHPKAAAARQHVQDLEKRIRVASVSAPSF